MKILYANCFESGQADVLLTDEVLVAEESQCVARITDALIDPETGHNWNSRLWELAYSWFQASGEDPSSVAGVSAADIAGAEVAQTILLPAARAALGVSAALRGMEPGDFGVVLPDAGPAIYRRVETVQCDAATAVAQAAGHRISPVTISRDARNSLLMEKYARVRDPEWLAYDRSPLRSVRRFASAAVNAVGARHRGGRVFVQEYNPTRAFAQAYQPAWCGGRRLIRSAVPLAEFLACARRADLIADGVSRGRLATSPVAGRLDAFAHARKTESVSPLEIGGADIWPVVWPFVKEVTSRYASFVASAAPRVRTMLHRLHVDAVLVPFDTPPEARLLVRLAQAAGIPTFVVNNGYLGDDFQQECMTADTAFAWSKPLADNYFARRHGPTIVTGNPKAEELAEQTYDPSGHVVIGSFTYSPIDVNCRRSDAESFLSAVLDGVAASPMAGRRIVLKLHPADVAGHYAAILNASPLDVELVSTGDVSALLPGAAVYITTYSTSLLEAVAVGIPIVYFRVNEQSLHPPFAGDEFVDARTATTSDELTALLAEPQVPAPGARTWAQSYLGPLDGGSALRIARAMGSEIAKKHLLH